MRTRDIVLQRKKKRGSSTKPKTKHVSKEIPKSPEKKSYPNVKTWGNTKGTYRRR